MYQKGARVGIICIVAAFLIWKAPSTAWALSVDQVIDNIARSERMLLNLNVEGEEHDEIRTQKSVWTEKGNMAHVVGWFDGMAGGLVRIDVLRQVMTSADDGSLWADSYSAAFNGKQGKVVRHTIGRIGQSAKSNSAVVTTGYPPVIGSVLLRIATGTFFSNQLFNFPDGKSLADIMKATAAFNKTVEGTYATAEPVDLKGVKAIKVSMGKKGIVDQSWWVDPARGYSLLAHETRQGIHNTLGGRYEVTDLVEAAPGVWYPREAYYYFPTDPGEAPGRAHYKASKVVANDPKFDEAIFTIDIPPGYTVDDRVNNKVYQSAPTTQDLEKDLDKAVDDAMRESQKNHPSSVPATPPAGDPTSLGYGVLPVRSASFGIFSLLGIGMLRPRRRSVALRPRMMLMAILLSGLTMPNQAQASQDAASNMDHRMNCGVNVGYMVLRRFDRSIGVDAVAKSLGLDSAYLNDCTLGDLRRLFAEHGLDVRALKAADIAEMLRMAKPGNALVVRFDWGSKEQPMGHFAVVLAAADGVVLADAVRPVRFLSFADLPSDKLFSYATGEFLIVTAAATDTSTNSPTIVLDHDEMDLGSIPLTPVIFEAKAGYRNTGDAPLKVTKASGPCSCFQGASGDLELAPGAKGTMIFKLDRNKLSAGHVTRVVTLETNDPKNPTLQVKLKFYIQADPAKGDIALSPDVIVFGRLSDAAILKKTMTLRLVLPMETDGSPSQVETSSNDPLLKVTQHNDKEFRERDGGLTRIVTYDVSWKAAPPDGKFDKEISLTIDRGKRGKQTIKVPVKGDCMAATATATSR